GIARQRRQLAHATLLRLPQDRAKLQNLRRVAGGIAHGRLGPADDLTGAVDAGREPLLAAERGQRGHDAILPDEADTDMSGDTRQERGTAPLFMQCVERRGLAKARDHSIAADAGPLHDAVRSAECAERVECTAAPEGGDSGRIARTVYEAGDKPVAADAA